METGVSLDNGVTLEVVSDNGVTLDASIVLNGDLEVEEVSAPVIPTPKILEMSCTAENITDKGSDVQTYSSKLEEHSVLNEEGIVVTEKKYEESAIRTKSVKTEEGEVSTTSHILMKEKEKLHTSEEGTEVAEYNANCTEKHRTSVSSIETIGDQQVTRVKSSERTVSRNKTKVEEEGGEDKPKAITQTTMKDEHSKDKSIEKNEEAATIVHRRTSTTKSERCETKIIGGTGEEIDLSHLEKHSRILQGEANAGALIDLGALGEIKLGSTISDDGSKDEDSNSDAVQLSHGLELIDMGSAAATESNETVRGKTVTVDIAALTKAKTPESSPTTITCDKDEKFDIDTSTHVASASSFKAMSASESSTGVSASIGEKSASSLESGIVEKSCPVTEGSSSIETNSFVSSQADGSHEATLATHVVQESSQISKSNMAESKMAETTTASASHLLQQEFQVKGVRSEVSEHAQFGNVATGKARGEQVRGCEAGLSVDYRHPAKHRAMATENGEGLREESPSQIPLFKPDDRKTADDLVKRILAESRQEKSGKKKKVPTATLR